MQQLLEEIEGWACSVWRGFFLWGAAVLDAPILLALFCGLFGRVMGRLTRACRVWSRL